MSVFTLEMLPGGDGDCLVLTWGQPGSLRHIVVDGGRTATYRSLKPRLADMASAGEPLELFVLTHIDADHIEGALKFTGDGARPLSPRRVWFNGYDQMTTLQAFGEAQGDRYSAALAKLGWPLNEGFDHRVVAMETAPANLEIEGLKITLLSPDRAHLAAMRARWSAFRDGRARPDSAEPGNNPGVVSMGRAPMPAVLDVDALSAPGRPDRELPNGSSIAFVAEFEGHRVLLAGDAHPDLLAASIAPLAAAEGGRYRIDLLKVSHHGSRNNTSPELIGLLDCLCFAISTNGTIHGHPDPEAIARLLRFAPAGCKTLYFNYETDRTRPWGAKPLMYAHGYRCVWPSPSAGFCTIGIAPDGAA